MTRSADAFVRMHVIAADENCSPLTSSQRLGNDSRRTQTKWGELYPHWKEEEFKMLVATTDKKSLASHRLYFNLMDATKSGEDVHIGSCWLPLSVLLDQRKHSYWLRVDFSGICSCERCLLCHCRRPEKTACDQDAQRVCAASRCSVDVQ